MRRMLARFARGSPPVLQHSFLVRQFLSFRFRRLRNQQKTEEECDCSAGDRNAQRSHAQYCCAKKKINPGSNKAPDGSAERESRSAHTGLELFGQPERKDREV